MNPPERFEIGFIYVSIFLFVFGAWGLIAGLRLRYGSIPYFASD